MTELLLPAAVLVAAVTLTYFFCLRTMREGQACHQPTSRAAEVELDRALREARQELERLRTTLVAGQSTSSHTVDLAPPRRYTSASE